MADVDCKHTSPLLVDTGDVVSDDAYPLVFVIGDNIGYTSVSPMTIAFVSHRSYTHIQIPSSVTINTNITGRRFNIQESRYNNLKIKHHMQWPFQHSTSYKTINIPQEPNLKDYLVHLRP